MPMTEKDVVEAVAPQDKLLDANGNVINLDVGTPVLAVNPDATTIESLPDGAIWVETE